MSDFELSKQSYIEKHNDSLVMGLTHDDFREQKFSWVQQFLSPEKTMQLLDFGFGAGELLEDLSKLSTFTPSSNSKLSGVDPSETMRAELKSRNPSFAFQDVEDSLSSIADATIDLVTCFNVLHHISPAERPTVANQMFRKLKPGGQLLIWEHNPLNPGTQFVVCRCEYDHDAILLRRSETEQLFNQLVCERSEYVNFTPPSLHKFGIFRNFEAWFKSVPLGAQYRLVFRKPA